MAESLFPPPVDDQFIYTDEWGISYTWEDFLEFSCGNLRYARLLLERVTWQCPQTLVEEDERDGEILKFQDQIIILNQDRQNAEKLIKEIKELFHFS